VTVVEGVTAALRGQTLLVVLQGLAQARSTPTLLLFGRGHPDHAEGFGIAADITIQAQGQFVSIPTIGLDPRAILVPVARAHHVANDAQGRERSMQ